MKHSENYGFYLPSRDTDDIADINLLSHNFEKIDQELYEIGKGATADVDTSLFASAIQNTVSGGVVFAKDVSALDHTVKVKLSGEVLENLMPSIYVEPLPIYHNNNDGSYLINGVVPSDNYMPLIVFHSGSESLKPIEEGTYILDLGAATNQVYLQIGLNTFDYSNQKTYRTDSTGKVTFTVGAEDYLESLLLKATSGETIENLLIKPMLYKASSGTQDYSQVKLYRYGANSSVNKETYTPNADGTVDVPSLAPYMSLVTDKAGINITATYNIDTKAYVDKNKGGGGGVSGENGATFIPNVSADGVISWTNDKGLANPTPVNIKGEQGNDGYTPKKGTDYWTDADKEEIIADINGSYETVDSIEKMTDTSKAYVLSTDGNIYAYANVTVKHEAKNKFVPSEATINKSMTVSALEARDGFVWSNAISVDLTKETPFRIKVEGTKITEDTSEKQKLWLCADELGTQKTNATIIRLGVTAANFTTLLDDGTIYADYSGGTRLNDSIINQIKTVRIGFKFSDTAITSTDELNGVKITFPSENYEETVSTWINTGIKPSASGGGVNYVDLFVKLAEIQAMLSAASRGISDD